MIRKVNDNDAAAIAAIYRPYVIDTDISFETVAVDVPEMLQRIKHISASFPYIVYENDNGEILGYAYAHPWKERVAYSLTLETSVYVAQSTRHHGIGTELMLALIDECRNRGFVALIACITGNNTASIKFHEKLGFTKVSHFKNVGYKHNQFLDVVDLELLL